MASITGLKDTEDLIADERPKNYRAGILLNNPNGDTPLAAVSSLLSSETTDDPEFKWFEKPMNANRAQVAADYTNVATTITLTAGTYTGALQFKKGDILLAEHTRELIRLTEDPSTDTTLANVDRDWGDTGGGTALTVATDNPYLSKIGSVNEEGALPPTAKAYPPSVRFGATQIFRDSIAITRTAKKTRSRVGDHWAENKREGLEMHMNAIERASFFSIYDVDEVGTDGHPMRATDGILNVLNTYASSNVVTALTPDLDWLELQMFNIFDRGSDEKMCFCGNRFMLTIQQIIRDGAGGSPAYQLMTDQTDFGWRIRRLISPFGELVLKRHPLFNEMKDSPAGPGTYTGMSSSGVVLDMKDLRWRHLPGDDTHFIPDVTEKGRDGQKGEWLTEAGWEIRHANHHYWIDGLYL